ncbi:MAG: hypothetical protein EXQ52_02180 [Bryobacterales bacterium]|nr:hypothetical protein [Bryobacterales bacterium]
MLPGIEAALRAAGVVCRRFDAGQVDAFIIEDLPESLRVTGIDGTEGIFVIAAGAVPGLRILESGTLFLTDGMELLIHRCAPAVPEPHGNLQRRAAWFQKRHGSSGP